MTKLILGFLTLSLTLFGLAACGDNAANTNTVRVVNSNTTNMNSNMSSGNMTNGNMSNANMSNMNNEVSSAADTFMTSAAQGGMMEVELGKLAASKAANPEVKAFGQKMVVDHGKANDELKALAAKKNVNLPTELSGSMKETTDRLSKLSGAEFDREYVKHMVEAHNKDVEKFQTQTESATDADVKAFAQKTLPVLKAHYETIKKINDNMK